VTTEVVFDLQHLIESMLGLAFLTWVTFSFVLLPVVFKQLCVHFFSVIIFKNELVDHGLAFGLHFYMILFI